MSLKSAKETTQGKNTKANPLPLQIQALKSAMIDYIALSVFFFAFAVIIFNIVFTGVFVNRTALTQYEGELLVVGCMLFGGLLFGFAAARRSAILKELKTVDGSAEYTVSIHCRKVSCIGQILSKRTAFVLGLVLTDENGNKFYYIFPQGSAPSDSADAKIEANIKKQYSESSVELICYHNTNIVKAIQPKSNFSQ